MIEPRMPCKGRGISTARLIGNNPSESLCFNTKGHYQISAVCKFISFPLSFDVVIFLFVCFLVFLLLVRRLKDVPHRLVNYAINLLQHRQQLSRWCHGGAWGHGNEASPYFIEGGMERKSVICRYERKFNVQWIMNTKSTPYRKLDFKFMDHEETQAFLVTLRAFDVKFRLVTWGKCTFVRQYVCHKKWKQCKWIAIDHLVGADACYLLWKIRLTVSISRGLCDTRAPVIPCRLISPFQDAVK